MTFLLLSIYSHVGNATVNCSDFDAKAIKLITLDVFAATMDTSTSLQINIAKILTNITPDQVKALADSWMNAYGSYAGTTFDESVTGPSPFQWMLTTTLQQILKDMNIVASQTEFDALVNSWGVLIPWPATAEVLQKVAAAGIYIAPLSNGDKNTLKSAMSVFSPEVNMQFIFTSDFPVGSFKPDSQMYAQVTRVSNLSEHEFLHIAGAPTDAQGARKYGIFAGLVYNVPIPGPNRPCFAMKNITDLVAILGL